MTTTIRSCCQRLLLDHYAECDARRKDPEGVPAVEVSVTSYRVSCIPGDRHFTVHVREVQDGLWIATDGYFCLNPEGEWVEDPSGLYHRYSDEQMMLLLARAAAPHVTVLGTTVADALAQEATPTTEGPHQ